MAGGVSVSRPGAALRRVPGWLRVCYAVLFVGGAVLGLSRVVYQPANDFDVCGALGQAEVRRAVGADVTAARTDQVNEAGTRFAGCDYTLPGKDYPQVGVYVSRLGRDGLESPAGALRDGVDSGGTWIDATDQPVDLGDGGRLVVGEWRDHTTVLLWVRQGSHLIQLSAELPEDGAGGPARIAQDLMRKLLEAL